MTTHFTKIYMGLSCACGEGYIGQALLSNCVDDWKQDLDKISYVGVLS